MLELSRRALVPILAIVVSGVAAASLVRLYLRSRQRTDCPSSKPDTSIIVGHYRSHDSRMPNASLDLTVNGTFVFTSAAGQRGSGNWKLETDYAGCWELILAYDGPSPEKASFINRPIKHQQPPYMIMFFANPLDKEATVPFLKEGS